MGDVVDLNISIDVYNSHDFAEKLVAEINAVYQRDKPTRLEYLMRVFEALCYVESLDDVAIDETEE